MIQASDFQSARRQFFAGSAKTGGALAALGIVGSGLGLTSGAQALTASAAMPAAPDLLFHLGARIAVEIHTEIGTATSGYSIHFLDCAGPSCNSIRQGLQTAMAGHGIKTQNSFEEIQGQNRGALGLVTIRNLDTGRQASVELFPESLSQIGFIETSGLDAELQHAHFHATPQESLFGVRYA